MSDASEVKRWEIYNLCVLGEPMSAVVAGPFTDPKVRAVEVIAVEDHDRIVAERDELWERATKFVMPGEMDTGESIEHYIKTLERTIATQSRKLDLARVLYHAAIKMIDRYSKEKFPLNQTHTVENVMDRYDQELAAIEKGDKP